jgi:hypothetical protein
MAAIYQWFSPNEAPVRSDYELFLLQDDHGDYMRFIGIDLTTGEYREYGSRYAGSEQNFAVPSFNGKFIYTPGFDGVHQWIWRGHCFSYAGYHSIGTTNGQKAAHTIRTLENHLIVQGANDFGHGIKMMHFNPSPPYDVLEIYGRTAPYDNWVGCNDLRYGNKDQYTQRGDTLVMTPENGGRITLFQNVDGKITQVAQASASASTRGNTTAWTMNPDTGVLCTEFTNSPSVDLWQIDMTDLTNIYKVGRFTVPSGRYINAAIDSNFGYLLTWENSDVLGDYFCTYAVDRDLLTLTLVDEWNAGAAVSTSVSAQFHRSTRTQRIWTLCPDSAIGLVAFDVQSNGALVRDVQITGHTGYNSGGAGERLQFIDVLPEIVGNGYSGKKAKLFAHWECDEDANADRIDSMGNLDLIADGTMSRTMTPDGYGAQFGLGALRAAQPVEMETTGSFAMCFDVWLDSLTSTVGQTLVQFGAYDTGAYTQRKALCQFTLAERFTWGFHYGNDSGDGDYVADADITTPATATKYHVYLEYDSLTGTAKIRVNGGTTYTVAMTGNAIPFHGQGLYIKFGREGSLVSTSWGRLLQGVMRNIYYFWTPLTDTEQLEMYNGGASVDFSTL